MQQDQKAWSFIRGANEPSELDSERIALIDGSHRYTYRAMFREWERYASVFAALGMTGADRSRVGIFGSTCAEALFAIYGLNMVGSTVSIIPWKILEYIMPEKKPFKMPEIPEGVRKVVLKYGNRLAGIPHGRKSIPFDFED